MTDRVIQYKYKDFLPYNTLTSEPALTPYEHVDASSRADPEKKALFAAIPTKKDMTPNIGTEVSGIQLSQLTPQQRDELALWVAERGLVIFRNQDFVDQGIDWLREFGSYFGRLHVHQWGVHPKDAPELTVVFRDSDKGSYFDNQSEGNLNTVSWHTGKLHHLGEKDGMLIRTLQICRMKTTHLELPSSHP